MKLIQTQTIGTATASLTFSAIPGTPYTDLVLVIAAANSTGTSMKLQFNSDTGANYANKALVGTGSAVSSSIGSSSYVGIYYVSSNAVDTANTFGSTSIYIPNYTSATAKTVLVDSVEENNGTTAGQGINAGSWSGTSAITSVVVTSTSGNLVAGSVLSLYGITHI